jgi:hypothetical protein
MTGGPTDYKYGPPFTVSCHTRLFCWWARTYTEARHSCEILHFEMLQLDRCVERRGHVKQYSTVERPQAMFTLLGAFYAGFHACPVGPASDNGPSS